MRSKYTSRHYRDVATMFRDMLADDKRTLFTASEVSQLTTRMIRLFESDNARFSAERFRVAIWQAKTTTGAIPPHSGG